MKPNSEPKTTTARKSYSSSKSKKKTKGSATSPPPPPASKDPEDRSGARLGRDPSGAAVSEEQVAERAKAIWYARGCPSGFDEQNWHQARAQLEAESARK